MSELTIRPYRSALYVPGSKPRALQKAATLACDAVIYDLEDAIAPAQKEQSRQEILAALRADAGRQARLVRVNGLQTAWGADDLRALGGAALDGVLVPKVGSAADVSAVAELLPGVPVWAMMETPIGVLNAAQIAAHPALAGMVVGTNDLQKDMNARFRPDRLPLQAGLGICVLAAKAWGRVILDGVYNTFGDADGLERECEQGRDMGFDGKTVIHPDQIAVANAVFSPSEAEIDLARCQIAAFDAAIAAGQGVAVLEGRIVEGLHVEAAKRILGLAAVTNQREPE